MSDVLVTALLATMLGLIAAIVTSFIIPYVQKRMEMAEHRRGIYERYAQPLAADSVNLLWRLHEILYEERGQYLLEETPATSFVQYKRISTCYRIAAIVGWIRAMRLEQSHLYGDQAAVDSLRRAVADFESALADSPRVEMVVVGKLAKLWHIKLPAQSEAVRRLSAQVVAQMQHFLGKYALDRYHELAGLDSDKGLELVLHIARSFTQTLNSPNIAEQVLTDTYPAALRIIGARQAWIYRDWQQAIGDAMIREVNGGVRRFDVIGYSKFSEKLDPWFDRLWDLVKGIDLREAEEADLRLQQLRQIARALAKIVCSIETLDLERRIIDPQACDLARKFLAELPAMDAAA